jgi:hypothetical protein
MVGARFTSQVKYSESSLLPTSHARFKATTDIKPDLTLLDLNRTSQSLGLQMKSMKTPRRPLPPPSVWVKLEARSNEEAHPLIKRERSESSNEQREEKKPAKRRMIQEECIICCKDKGRNQYPLIPHQGARRDDHWACFKCWEDHLHVEISSQDWDKLKCLVCAQVLMRPDIQKLEASFKVKISEK